MNPNVAPEEPFSDSSPIEEHLDEQQTLGEVTDIASARARQLLELADEPRLAATTSIIEENEHLRGENEHLKQHLESIEQDANHDALTGLLNRRQLTANLADQIENNPGNFALMFLDLDGLKKKNDIEGHEAGDAYIKRAAEIMEDTLRTSQNEEEPRQLDTIYPPRSAYRLGGDEFVVLLSDVSTEEQFEAAENRIMAALQEGGVAASMGGRLHQAGEDAQHFIDAVDVLMYGHKTKNHDITNELARQESLQRAIDNQDQSFT